MSTTELVDLKHYSAIMHRLREKVAREITDSNAYDMLITHLGERFGLFAESDYSFSPTAFGTLERVWDVKDFEEAFEIRHRIVHKGKLPLADLVYTDRVSLGFKFTTTFLTQRAVDKFGLEVDSKINLAVQAKLMAQQSNRSAPDG